MPKLFLLLLIIFPLVSMADLEFNNGWIRNLPPTVPVRAGYLEIFNSGNEAVSIKSIQSKSFETIEVHQTIMKDGMMHMQPVPDLSIDPGSTIILRPGGMHLMMMHPVEPTKLGDEIRIDVMLSDDTQQSLIFTVKK